MEMIELMLIWAMGHISGIAIMLLCVWVAEKTGHRSDWYINREGDDEECD